MDERLLILLISVLGCSLAENIVLETPYGKVEGMNVDKVSIFYGIPFAKPPVGNLRWNPPEKAESWGSHVYNATFQRPSCPQVHCDDLSPPLVCPTEISEDCLYLDIFTPQITNPNITRDWAVMVFIHGGNFVRMSGTSPLLDGRNLAGTRDVIIVNINYRMGALGFLVTGEATNDARGNYGIQDQQFAMKWVKDNIGYFGGDPSKITLFGESAGAQSTLIHYTLRSSAPYFRNAIIESSPISIPYKRFPEAIIIGALLAELLGCQPRDMNCMRGKTWKEIADAQYKTRSKVSSLKLLEFFEPWGPFVDGEFIQKEPLGLLQEGDFNKKPMIIGTVAEETVQYIFSAWNSSVNMLTYEEVVFATYPSHVFEILSMYPPTENTTDERNMMVKMSTDLVFACPTRNATRNIRSYGVNNVWTYVWDHAFSFPGWGHVTYCEGRVCHGSELVYLFHTEAAGGFHFTAEEEVLSRQIMDFWTNFAKRDNPNSFGGESSAPKALNWPVYSREGSWPYYRFKAPESKVEVKYHDDNCNFWDTIGYAA